jgi:hypothetical protein
VWCPVSIADGRTQAGLRVHVDVVVYRRDPAMYGRMIVLDRELHPDRGGTFVICEVDPPEWRFKGVSRSDMGPYDVHLELFDAADLWTEAEWAGVGQARDDAVAAGRVR